MLYAKTSTILLQLLNNSGIFVNWELASKSYTSWYSRYNLNDEKSIYFSGYFYFFWKMWKSTMPFAGMMLEFLVTLRQGIFMEMIAQGQEVFLYRGIMQIKIMGSAGAILGKGSRTG